MKASKLFIVIAYDISDNKRRNRVVKLLKQYGIPVNFSVYECMMTKPQLDKVIGRLEKVIDTGCDKIVYYTICIGCFSKIIYQPEQIRRKVNISTII